MEAQLDPTVFTDETNYFFTMLTDRYEALNKIWKESLEKELNQKFEPIYILPAVQSNIPKNANYIIVNDQQQKINESAKNNKNIYIPYTEDINKQFSGSTYIKGVIAKLLNKQKEVFILPFSTVWLDINIDNVVILGPDRDVAEYFDNKINQYNTFKDLGLSTNDVKTHVSFQDLLDNHEKYPFFVSATYSSGGTESRMIATDLDLELFTLSLRTINRSLPFIEAPLIEDIKCSPNISALITNSGEILIIHVTDQILRGNKYLGNVYPSIISDTQNQEIIQMTVKIGLLMHSKGFRGLFGVDYIVTQDGGITPVDINPRRQGGYLCDVLSSAVDIINLEVRTYLALKLPSVTYDSFQTDYCWAHSKILPYEKEQYIIKSLTVANPWEPFISIGSEYHTIFYPEGYLLIDGNAGYDIVSGKTRKITEEKILKNTQNIINESFS